MSIRDRTLLGSRRWCISGAERSGRPWELPAVTGQVVNSKEPLVVELDLWSPPHVFSIVSYFIFQVSYERFDIFITFADLNIHKKLFWSVLYEQIFGSFFLITKRHFSFSFCAKCIKITYMKGIQ